MQLELRGVTAVGSLRYALDHLMTVLECKEPTRRMHDAHRRYLLGFFGDRQLADFGYPDIRRYLDEEHRRGVGRETIRKRLSTLHMALCEAVRMAWLEKVPPWPVIKGDSKPKEGFWTREQWEKVHAVCDDDEGLRIWIAVGWWTGQHSSDLDRFRWDDVDLARGRWVRRNTKTSVKPIDLPMPLRLLEILRRRHDDLQPHKRDLVAGRRIGHPNREIKALAARAGVPAISPIEAARHSCETYLEECGTTELFQMTWLGLKSPAMLKRHYRHITTPTIDDGLAKINAAG